MKIKDTGNIPGGVYIYTSRTMYLNIDPAYLMLTSGMTLVPEIVTIQVDFAVGAQSCNIDGHTSMSTYVDSDINSEESVVIAASSAHRAQIYSLLEKMLTPKGQKTLKGALVRLGGENVVPGYQYEFFILKRSVFVGNDGVISFIKEETNFSALTAIEFGEWDIDPYVEERYTQKTSESRVVVWLNIGTGMLVACVVTMFILSECKYRLVQQFTKEKISDMLKANNADVNKNSRKKTKKQALNAEVKRKFFNPLEYPIEVGLILYLQPT